MLKTISLTSCKPFRKQSTAGWREFGGRNIYYRSQWEANYGRYLQWQKDKGLIKDWSHEPFIFRFEGLTKGCTTYLPDFKITALDGSHYWVEVKGYYDKKSVTKLKRMKKYYPDEEVRTIDKKWFVQNNERMRIIVKEWERG